MQSIPHPNDASDAFGSGELKISSTQSKIETGACQDK